MTIISSVRQVVEAPIYAITEGSSPVISYNYGAHRYKRVKQAAVTMGIMALIYTLLAWLAIILAPEFLISIFSSDKSLLADAVPAMKLYFGAFIFMLLQYIIVTIFKSLNKETGDLSSLLRSKVIIVSSYDLSAPACIS